MQIASSVLKAGSKDIRDILKIAKLCNPMDAEEDINRLILIHQKYRKTGREYNWQQSRIILAAIWLNNELGI